MKRFTLAVVAMIVSAASAAMSAVVLVWASHTTYSISAFAMWAVASVIALGISVYLLVDTGHKDSDRIPKNARWLSGYSYIDMTNANVVCSRCRVLMVRTVVFPEVPHQRYVCLYECLNCGHKAKLTTEDREYVRE